ncbi:MAG: D-amino-acid transaminase [Hyphomicrobiaceae bacterium]
MARRVYVNGRYLPYAQAMIHAEDRGFLFGDAVYEVCTIEDGRIVDERRHLDRLDRSLAEIGMAQPMSRPALHRVMKETVRQNGVRDGIVYLEISRGAAGPRNFRFPSPGTRPTVVCLARSISRRRLDEAATKGIAVVTVRDIRWHRPDIKTVQLLAAVLAKEEAAARGGAEAWLVDPTGYVTEGASSNAWIVAGNGRVVTRPAEHGILRGVTRMVLLDVLAAEGLTLCERAFRVEEAYEAHEAFITSASNTVMPVVSIDGHQLGEGRPGPVTMRLRKAFATGSEYT